jgi:hypothetical protein
MNKILINFFIFSLILFWSCKKSEPTGEVFFVEPIDNAEVTSPFLVKFGVKDLEVAPAGEIKPNSGHHHILINLDSIASGETIPADEKHIHFGKGQTETSLSLDPGTYKITLQFANGAHQSYGPSLSKSITVVVK